MAIQTWWGSGPRLGSSDRKSLTVLIVSILLQLCPPSTSADAYLFKYIIVGDTGVVKEMDFRMRWLGWLLNRKREMIKKKWEF